MNRKQYRREFVKSRIVDQGLKDAVKLIQIGKKKHELTPKVEPFKLKMPNTFLVCIIDGHSYYHYSPETL